MSKPLTVPFSTSTKRLCASASARSMPCGGAVSTIRTLKGAATILSSWKALTTVWLPGRNRWTETTLGRRPTVATGAAIDSVIVCCTSLLIFSSVSVPSVARTVGSVVARPDRYLYNNFGDQTFVSVWSHISFLRNSNS